MIVEATDGRYYLKPWFSTPALKVWYDVDSDHFTLSIADRSKYTVNKALKFFGIAAKTCCPVKSQQSFDGEFLDCTDYTITFTKPIPIPHEHSGSWDFPGTEELICWSIPFGLNTILQIMLNNDNQPDKLLFKFLEGGDLRRKIRQQVPYLKGAKLTEMNYSFYFGRLLAQYGPTIRLKRKVALDSSNQV